MAVKPFVHLLCSRDGELDKRFDAALNQLPPSERPVRTAIWSTLRGIERSLDRTRNDLRDCAVIAARINDKLTRFNASETPR